MATGFHCISYNVLANAYARPERYPLVDAEVLKWETRKYALERKVAVFDTDILCLQEVEEDAYAFLEQSLGAKGYRGVYAQKAQNKPDGCAIFFRQECLQYKSSDILYYHDGNGNGAFDSGHLALILSFEYGAGLLHVANTHLKWDRVNRPQEQHCGNRQIKELLEHSMKSPYAQSAALQGIRTVSEGRLADGPSDGNAHSVQSSEFEAGLDPHEEAWIMCGDFNAQPDSPLIQELLKRGFRDAYAGHEQDTCNPNCEAKRIDYLFHTANLSSIPGHIFLIEDLTPLPSIAEPSDHLAIMATFSKVETQAQRECERSQI